MKNFSLIISTGVVVSFISLLTACNQNFHITQEAKGFALVDDIIAGTSASVSTSTNISTNDVVNCQDAAHTVTAQNNVNVTGTAPKYDVTPLSSGPWDFTYSVTCSDGTTGTANVSGIACEAQQIVLNTLTPIPGDQFYTPSGSTVTHIHVKAWGAGGGGGDSIPDSFGGAGGYSEAILNSANYLVVVAEGGQKESSAVTYGGGGAGGFAASGINRRRGSSGGGLSGVFDSSGFISSSQANSLVIAAGGGGGGIQGTAASGTGGAGGYIGEDGIANSVSLDCNSSSNPGMAGLGATQSSGGLGGINSIFPGDDGAALSGGSAFMVAGTVNGYHGSGGGGSGYFGGGAGATGVFIPGSNNACETGAGGGSGFVSSLSIGGEVLNATGTNSVPNSTDLDYITGVGISGANGAGGDGLVVIQELCAATNLNEPFAFIDRFSTSINSPITVNVIINDVDVDGDLDASSLSVITNAPPGEGSCVLGSGSGEIDFSPAIAFTGDTSCQYQVCDSSGLRCDTAEVLFSVL